MKRIRIENNIKVPAKVKILLLFTILVVGSILLCNYFTQKNEALALDQDGASSNGTALTNCPAFPFEAQNFFSSSTSGSGYFWNTSGIVPHTVTVNASNIQALDDKEYSNTGTGIYTNEFSDDQMDYAFSHWCAVLFDRISGSWFDRSVVDIKKDWVYKTSVQLFSGVVASDMSKVYAVFCCSDKICISPDFPSDQEADGDVYQDQNYLFMKQPVKVGMALNRIGTEYNVSIEAVDINSYNLVFENLTTSFRPGASDAPKDLKLTISATPHEGFQLSKFVIKNKASTAKNSINLEVKPGDASTTLTEESPLEVLPVFEPIPIHPITVLDDDNGTAYAYDEDPEVPIAGGTEGSLIHLLSTPNPGWEFDRWDVISPADLSIENDSFLMPLEEVSISAVFKEIKDPVPAPDPEPSPWDSDYSDSFLGTSSSDIVPSWWAVQTGDLHFIIYVTLILLGLFFAGSCISSLFSKR